MDHDSFQAIRELLQRGKYQEVIDHIGKKLTTGEEFPYLIEANLELRRVDSAESLLEKWEPKLNTDLERVKWYLYRGWCHNNRGAYQKALKTYFKGEKILSSVPDKKLALNFKFWIAAAHWRIGSLEKASTLLHDLIGELEKHFPNDELIYLARAYQVVASINQSVGRTDQALEYHQRALAIRKRSKNEKYCANSLNDIAIIFKNRGQFDKALEYHQQALSMLEPIEVPDTIAMSINDIGVVYLGQGKFKKALEYFDRAFTIWEKMDHPQRLHKVLSNKGNAFRELNQFEESLNCLQQALAFQEKIGNPEAIAESSVSVAYVLMLQGKLTKETDVLVKFPRPPYDTPVLHGYKHIIDALLFQQGNDLEAAEKSWQKASTTEGMTLYYLQLCHEALTEITFNAWKKNESTETQNCLINRLYEWETFCQVNNLSAGLCKVFLLRAKLKMSKYQIAEAKTHYHECMVHAGKNGLVLHYKLAKVELEKLSSHTRSIESGLKVQQGKMEQEQLEEFTKYLKDLSKFLRHQDRSE